MILTFESRLRSGPTSNVKIIKSTRNIQLLVVLMILTFAPAQAGLGCKCQNRTTSNCMFLVDFKILTFEAGPDRKRNSNVKINKLEHRAFNLQHNLLP